MSRKLPKESPIDLLEQMKSVQRKSDKILGKYISTYDEFCDAIDSIIHPSTMDFWEDMPIGMTRPRIKAHAEHLHKATGQSYYEIFLEFKFNK